MGAPLPVHRSPRRGHPTSITQLYGQGGLHPEDALPRRNNTGGLRSGGFHCTIGSPCPAPSGTANQGATCHAVSFRQDGVSSAGTPLKTTWHGLLRALAQEWTNRNCTITSANNFSGQPVVILRISPVQSAVSVRKPTLNRPFICPILSST
jgi:hypothetical protein